ncbi:DNA repair protein XRCC2 homolog isoform X1 [Andrographis paniculata]|uniref:DNA repair protein XRCC2 homolog isoform X1 n=1 Tax=Andrographis paniculata TaxID=175694 RepID=UPI0021E75D1A|nr:DNA repair protein XRCC2 homolog isoform X1 [Andrographis paniculata]
MAAAFSWIKIDETAQQALVRILTERPFVVLPPPIHRLPVRVGNVVEIVGPSPSAKTLILIQAAINCILPKEWKGVQYGGLERAVLFVDLDCRFDVFSLSRALERRIAETTGTKSRLEKPEYEFDKDLFAACMNRFLYTRCYSSYEFLSTLKTLPNQLQDKDKQGSGAVYMLMIDSIGAFYWMDRAVPYSSTGNSDRKSLSLQTVAESVVQEIQKIMLVHPLLVVATKSVAFNDKQSATEVMRNSGRRSDDRVLDSRVHREYMPSVWQSFVSHRILLSPSDTEGRRHNRPAFSTEWLLPPLKFSDNFTVHDNGALVII